MTFFDRYSRIAEKQNLDPCSQKAADMFGLTKATISTWGIKGTTPKGETVAVMADKLGVSADYLLGRTNDPTDYAKHRTKIDPDDSGTISGNKTIHIAKPDAKADPIIILIDRLDPVDRLKAEGVIQGLLMQDKYIHSDALPDAAHIRTDTTVTDDMISHDEKLMNDDDF